MKDCNVMNEDQDMFDSELKSQEMKLARVYKT
jgi:hypothetical protein